ncbi:MAG: hypothetical protein ACAH65_10005, partial [Chloroflexota bacterium]
MTADPRAFLAVDHGAATTSVALIGRVGSAWRWLGGLAIPASADVETAVATLVDRSVAADPDLAEDLGLIIGAYDDLPRLTARSKRPSKLAVVAGSERALAALRGTADRSGWRTVAASVESVDPLSMTALLLDPSVEAVLAGAGDPPRPDERSTIAELASLVAAVALRRPDLPIILAGGLSEGQAAFGNPATRPGEVLLAPAAATEPDEAGDPLATFLLELAMPVDDPRRAVGAATQTLADILDRRVETIVLGHDASVRASASPSSGGISTQTRLAVVPSAAVAPDDPDDAVVDGVLVWSTVPSDRHRLRDRLRELRIAPWADVAGEGAALRMAAARAALGRLVEHTPGRVWTNAPDLVVTAGGVWSSVPAPTVTLALVDVIRRTGASQFALDHGRLLSVLGAILDPGERHQLLSDLADDLLAPLGSVVTPAGLRAGRSAGSLTVHAGGSATELDLVPGGLELVDLAPGETAVAEFKFRDTVRLATRGRHFAVDVGGGLAGLLVDLRDVPLRLPDRA